MTGEANASGERLRDLQDGECLLVLMSGAVSMQMEPHPDFMAKLREAGAGKKGVILACEAGGTTRPTPSFQFGKSSRSLTAAFR